MEPGRDPRRAAAAGGWRITWVSGPDAGRSRLLAAGDHVVGRSPLATVPCDDPSLEPFHLRLRLGATDPDATRAGVAWCQLTGRRPVEARGDELVMGSSVLRIEPADADVTDGLDPIAEGAGHAGDGHAGDVGDVGHVGGTVVRRPRRRIEDPTPPLEPAALADLSRLVRSACSDAGDARDGAGYDGASTTLLPAAVTLAAGVVLALALGQPMLLLMGAVGAVLALTMWGAGLVRRRRQRHRRALAVAAAAARLDAVTTQHRAAVERARRLAQPGLPGAWRTITDTSRVTEAAGLWARRPEHGDAFTAVVGTGTGLLPALADHTPAITLADVPTLTDLGPGARVALTGTWANSLARSLVVQLAVTTGPADWQLVLAVEDDDAWRWAAALPHVRLTADGAVVHGDAALGELASAAADGRHLIVVTDAVDRIAVRTAGLRRLLHARADVALLVTTDDLVPALCTTTWVTAADGSVRPASHGFDADPPVAGGAAAARSSIQGLGVRAAADIAELLSRWIDPEAPADDRRLTGEVGLEALWADSSLTIERTSIARRWRAAGADAAPAAPIGAATEGAVEIDLVRDGPHALVAGTTGSGKSELLRSLVLSLAASVSPAQLAFVLVDFKGGATFDGLAGLPHVAGVVTDLEPRLAARVLRSLRAEVTRREHLLRALGHPDLPSARAATGTPVAPRLAIVVDEFAALAIEHPHLLHALVDVARRGRSLGVHLVLATQRPAGVVSEEIRTNTDLRIALRLHEAAEAMEVVGDPSPAAIRRDAAGRAVMRLGPGELLPFQTARPADVRTMVEEIRQAATSLGLGPAARPWCDPLPEVLDDTDGDGSDRPDRLARPDRLERLGLVDLPDDQRQDDLAWAPADGHVLVVGSIGSGVTTALAGLALRRLAPDAELVVVDATGDPRWASVAGHPRCAVVAALHEIELVDRALRRAVAAPPAGGRVVVLDGLGALRRDLEPLHRSEARDHLEALVMSPPAGVTLVLGNDGTAGLGPAVVSRCARRFVLHLHDPSEAGGLGVRAGDVPSAVPGRFVDATLGCEGQFASWPAAALVAGAHHGLAEPIGPVGPVGPVEPVERVTTLPADVAAATLPVSWSDERSWFVPIGVAHDDLRPVAFEVPHGEHLLVIGPARSGRSEVLAGFRRSWSQARPDAAQAVIAPRRLSGEALVRAVAEAVEQVEAEQAAGRPVLLVIDDADLVADVGGALAALATGHRPLLTMAVACRPDSVRSTYGHWAASLRRHRRGVLMAACDELDGDLLGAVLPRHLPVAARPGLCWLVGDGTARLVQAARRGEPA